ncbi:alpha/beta hydrolase [Terribacillus saccharophilus]|uniref:alpha/beta hydrolase n=1 Tax=Terribacillus saccharophilus TaxID=361277 RepID=UPI003981F016
MLPIADVGQWDADLDRNIKKPQNAYFICHSLGCITFLRYLLRHDVQIIGAIFVSGFAEKLTYIFGISQRKELRKNNGSI